MLRHEFQPGRLLAGMFLTVAGIAYAGDARGAWETPWFAIVPIVGGGLFLAAVAGLLARSLRRGRTARGEPHAEGDRATAP